MHEAATMQGIVTTILEKLEEAGASQVSKVQLVLSRAGHFDEQAVRQYFEVLTRDTPAANARLLFDWEPALYQCLTCLNQFDSPLPAYQAVCPHCQGLGVEIGHSHDCYVSSIEVVQN